MRVMALLSVSLVATSARAELREKVVGLELLLLLPRLESGSPTSFATTAPGTRLSCAFGVTSEIYAVARATLWRIGEAYVANHRLDDPVRGRMVGDLRFHGEGYRFESGAKWKAVDGYNLSPYVEGYLGWQWATFRGVDLRRGGETLGADVSEFAEGSITASLGVSLDYRIANTLLVGGNAHWTHAFDDIYHQDLSFSLLVAYYWF